MSSASPQIIISDFDSPPATEGAGRRVCDSAAMFETQSACILSNAAVISAFLRVTDSRSRGVTSGGAHDQTNISAESASYDSLGRSSPGERRPR
jgi:hypothetical protein